MSVNIDNLSYTKRVAFHGFSCEWEKGKIEMHKNMEIEIEDSFGLLLNKYLGLRTLDRCCLLLWFDVTFTQQERNQPHNHTLHGYKLYKFDWSAHSEPRLELLSYWSTTIKFKNRTSAKFRKEQSLLHNLLKVTFDMKRYNNWIINMHTLNQVLRTREFK